MWNIWFLSLHYMEVKILLKYIRCHEKGKCVDIHVNNDVENFAEQKPINYIMENLSHKWICTVCCNHNSVIIASFVIFLTDTNGPDFWIGANDEDIGDDWVWESEMSKLLFSDWHVVEPNNYDDDEDCGTIRWHNALYKWNDAPRCKDNLYICEK